MKAISTGFANLIGGRGCSSFACRGDIERRMILRPASVLIIASISLLLAMNRPAMAVQKDPVIRAVRPAQFARPPMQVRFSAQQFDKSVFDQLTEADADTWCHQRLQIRLDFLRSIGSLSESQVGKLQLAGQIDIHRFFTRYRAIKRTLHFGTVDPQQWRTQFSAAKERVVPLQAAYRRGLHGPDSLFDLVLWSVVTPEQAMQIREGQIERQKARYANDVRIAIGLIERKIPMTDRQRTEVTRQLMNLTVPRERFGNTTARVFEVVGRLAEIKDSLKPVFTPSEWESVQQLIEASEKAVNALPNP